MIILFGFLSINHTAAAMNVPVTTAATARNGRYANTDSEYINEAAKICPTLCITAENIPAGNTHLPDGMEPDSEKECRRYEELIQSMGSVDLQLLGIGHNGHIGFNEPADAFDKLVHCVNLTQSTIEANKRFFASAEEVPRQAYTMGIQTIMRSKKILIIANGEGKADIVRDAFFGPITPMVPASVLQLHNDVTLVADEAALSKIPASFV